MATSKSLLIAGLLTGLSAIATNQASASQCGGYVTQVSVDASGKVGVTTTGDSSGGVTGPVAFASNYLCNLNSNSPSTGSFQITPKACERIYNSVLSAYLSGRVASFWFTGSTCPTFSAWSDAFALTSNQFYNVVLR